MTNGEQNSFEDAFEQLNLASEEGDNFSDAAEITQFHRGQRRKGGQRAKLKQCQVRRDRVVLSTKGGFTCVQSSSNGASFWKTPFFATVDPILIDFINAELSSSEGLSSLNVEIELLPSNSMAKPKVLPAIRADVKIAQRHNKSPATLAIGIVLKHPLLTSVAMGATQMWRLREILNATRVHLCEEVLAEIEAVHERYPNPTP